MQFVVGHRPFGRTHELVLFLDYLAGLHRNLAIFAYDLWNCLEREREKKARLEMVLDDRLKTRELNLTRSMVGLNDFLGKAVLVGPLDAAGDCVSFVDLFDELATNKAE